MKMIKLDAIDSTNSYLKRLLLKDSLDDLTVVVSKYQTSGKGRNGNIWQNQASLNLAFSIYKKFNNLNIKDKFMLNVISSLSVFQLLKENNLNLSGGSFEINIDKNLITKAELNEIKSALKGLETSVKQ